jgi:hypothetical protein
MQKHLKKPSKMKQVPYRHFDQHMNGTQLRVQDHSSGVNNSHRKANV